MNKKKISKKEKIMRKLDKPITIISIILIIIMAIIIVVNIINSTNPIESSIPNESIINQTCEKFNMYPAGHMISYKEQKTYILCGTPYIPEEKILRPQPTIPCAKGRECIQVCDSTLLVMRQQECIIGCTTYKGKIVGYYELLYAIRNCENKTKWTKQH